MKTTIKDIATKNKSFNSKLGTFEPRYNKGTYICSSNENLWLFVKEKLQPEGWEIQLQVMHAIIVEGAFADSELVDDVIRKLLDKAASQLQVRIQIEQTALETINKLQDHGN